MLTRPGLAVLPAVLAFILLSSMALADTAPVKYSWTAPVNGSDAVRYRVEMRFGENQEGPFGPWGEMGAPTETNFIFTFTKGFWYQVRVRAQDQQGLLGPYSPASTPYRVPADPEEETGEQLDPLPPESIEGPVPVGGGSGGGSG